jgi:hypothetical protein
MQTTYNDAMLTFKVVLTASEKYWTVKETMHEEHVSVNVIKSTQNIINRGMA